MTNQNPKISIVIPSYNKARFIGQTLESVVGQKYPNFELIIQDGGSTDGTLEIIKSYAKKYPKVIRWESGKDEGQLDAINKGLSRATGEIFTYINADDIYKPRAFALVADMYSKNPNALWFVGRGTVIDEKGHEIAKLITLYKNFFLWMNRTSALLIFNYLMQPSVFITDKAFKKYGPFTGTDKFVTEYDLWLKLSKVSMPIAIDKELSGFRLSGGSISSTSFKNTLDEDYKIVKKYTNNPLVLLIHKLNNWGRGLVVNILKT